MIRVTLLGSLDGDGLLPSGPLSISVKLSLLTIFFIITKSCIRVIHMLRKTLCKHFHNTYTTIFMWRVDIGGQKSNYSDEFKLELVTTYHIRFVVKLL